MSAIRAWITTAVVAGVGLLLFLRPGPDSDAPPPPATHAPSAAVSQPSEPATSTDAAPAAAPSEQPADARDELRIPSGGSLALDLRAAAAAGSVPRIALDLEVPATRFGPRPVRLLSEGREPFVLEATIAEQDPTSARLELPPEALPPGRYIVEVRTDERTHIPLRRYVLEVR